jgi:glutamyl-tRNA reductase
MRLYAIGLSHRTAPVELRECVDFARGGLEQALASLATRGIGREMVVLSTCNRAEIYAVGDTDATAEGVSRFFSEYHNVPHEQMAEHLYVRNGAEAARHLFRVAAGLDSLVVGEPQILGQVKAAYATAHEGNFTAALMNRLFHSAFAAGKRVRSETGLGEGAVSVSYAAIALAKKIFGDLKGRNVLILGAGEMAKLTGVHLQAQQVKQITIAGRTLSTAQSLAAHLGGTAVPWDALDSGLQAADIVVTATGASEPVLTRARILEAMRPCRGRSLVSIHKTQTRGC